MTKPAYYNEVDKQKSAWLRELIARDQIAPGDVDERSIADVRPDDLRGYRQCHFFAGIGIWSYALRIAGWDDDRECWTGSCPCPSFSAAGKGEGFDDPRHLWPVWLPLIRECGPPVVFGEQADAAIGHGWLDLVSTDLEAASYAVGAAVLGACSVGAPHRRQRLYFVAHSDRGMRGEGRSAGPGEEISGRPHAGLAGRSSAGLLADSGRPELEARIRRVGVQSGTNGASCSPVESGRPDGLLEHPESLGRIGRTDNPDGGRGERASGYRGEDGGLADTPRDGRREERPIGGRVDAGDRSQGLPAGLATGGEYSSESGRPGPLNGFWRDADWIFCRDRKWRPVRPGSFPLATGAPARMVRLRGYGDGITAQAAEAFIRAYMELEAAA